MLVQLHWRFLRRQPQLLPVHVEGQALQWSMSLLCSFTGAVRLLMVGFFLAVYTGTRPGPDSAVSVVFRSWHCLGQVDDMPAGVSFFWAVYTGTRPGVAPAIRAGKGWRGRRELAPRCSATRIRCI